MNPHLTAEAFEEFRRLIAGADRILVAGEPDPDADCCGAMVAIARLAREICSHDRIDLRAEQGVPKRWSWLEGTRRIKSPEAKDPEHALAILVDGGIERCGPKTAALVRRAQATVLIDHHLQGSQQDYSLRLEDPGAASTTVVIHDWAVALGLPLDPATAEALYLGLAGDTGGLRYSNADLRCFEVAQTLVAAGARPHEVAVSALLESPFDLLRLQARVLSRIRRLIDGRFLVASVQHSDLAGLQLGGVPVDRILPALSYVRGVEVTLLLKGGPGPGEAPWRRLSLRSRGRVDVAAIARQLDPGGGGHRCASGCRISGDDETITSAVEAAVRKALR